MIVEELIKKGFCFAVVKSYTRFATTKLYSNQHWEVIAASKDYKALKKLGFRVNNAPFIPASERNPEGIISRPLSVDEVREFKSNINEFIKVLDTPDGKVWEPLFMSLKDTLNTV